MTEKMQEKRRKIAGNLQGAYCFSVYTCQQRTDVLPTAEAGREIAVEEATMSWMMEDLTLLRPIKIVAHVVFWIPLYRCLMPSFTARTQRHAAAAPRPASRCVMLVESDVQPGLHSLLP